MRVLADAHFLLKEVTAYSSIDYLTDISMKTRRCLSTDTNRWVVEIGRFYFKSDTSIFTYQSIYQSIDLSTDGQNGRGDTSVQYQTSGCITWPIYQQRRGDVYQLTQINEWVVPIPNLRHQYSPINLLIDQLIYLSTDGKFYGETHQ